MPVEPDEQDPIHDTFVEELDDGKGKENQLAEPAVGHAAEQRLVEIRELVSGIHQRLDSTAPGFLDSEVDVLRDDLERLDDSIHSTGQRLEERLEKIVQSTGQRLQERLEKIVQPTSQPPEGRLEEIIQSTGRRLEERLEEIVQPTSQPPEERLEEIVQSTGRRLLAAVAKRMDDLQARIEAHVGKDGERLVEKIQALSDRVADLRYELETLSTRLTEVPAPQENEPEGERQWDEAILPPDLLSDDSIAGDRQKLLDDLLSGDHGAKALAAHLMLAQSAPADRLPEILKDVGEAYYQWRPRASASEAPLEKALAEWLTRRLKKAGLNNSIELVRPGERFDASRHIASPRGLAVETVRGWVVLRSNGKVYTKASVSAK